MPCDTQDPAQPIHEPSPRGIHGRPPCAVACDRLTHGWLCGCPAQRSYAGASAPGACGTSTAVVRPSSCPIAARPTRLVHPAKPRSLLRLKPLRHLGERLWTPIVAWLAIHLSNFFGVYHGPMTSHWSMRHGVMLSISASSAHHCFLVIVCCAPGPPGRIVALGACSSSCSPLDASAVRSYSVGRCSRQDFQRAFPP